LDQQAGGRHIAIDEQSAWLALIRAPRLGVQAGRQLVKRFGEISAAFSAPRRELEALHLPAPAADYLRHPDWARVAADRRWLEQPDHHLVLFSDSAFPSRLDEINTPPLALFVRGDPSLLNAPSLAIVGSRNPSPDGRRTARDFAVYLARCGLAIVSGMALGIDAAGHRGALAAGGATLAVCGTGLDHVYPARHKALADEIAAHGALVSEFPPETPAKRENFPRRNRLISGLSLGTLVVEAAIHSGSLITARLAGEQGREVFAIPGSIHHPLARGCHRLIREGAKLVESAADILEELAPLIELAPSAGGSPQAEELREKTQNRLDPDYARLLNSMDYAPTTVDRLVERTGLTPEVISSMLLMLELNGHVESAPGGRYSRITRLSE
jgi:DNA processing protein